MTGCSTSAAAGAAWCATPPVTACACSGVTLSRQQALWAQKAIADEGLADLAEVRHSDYRDVTETGFDAVSSIGLTEHIGVRNYPAYFGWIQDRLRPGGLLLNHCITRPAQQAPGDRASSSTATSSPTASSPAAGGSSPRRRTSGSRCVHEENLREHYALTLAQWCRNLVENWDECVAEVGEGTARVWGLYMAARD